MPQKSSFPRKHNIVLMFMDDMGYGDLGSYGCATIKAPNMDSLARDGVKFTQMYSAAPICSPSRAALLTGRYPLRVGIPNVLFPRDTIGLTDEETTVAEILKSAGYATCAIGKWHVGCCPEHFPTRHGFDRFLGLLYSNDMNPLHLYRDEEIVEDEVDQRTLTRKYTEQAIAFMREHKDEPFFIYLAQTMPHIPLHVESAFLGKSQAGLYGDTIECIDHYFGQILAELDVLGLADDTLVIVTSDNGPWFQGSVGGLRGRKFEVYEGGVRMPFLARLPGRIPAGSVCDEAAMFIDLLPTFARVAGAEPTSKKKIDGLDIWPLFEGGASAKTPHEAFYYYSTVNLNAIRAGKWKLHVARGMWGRDTFAMPELYNMEIDPQENYNLADRQPELVEKLKAMMEAFDAEVKAESPYQEPKKQ